MAPGGTKGGKWLTGVVPSAPARDAARVALETRWRIVAHYLPRAARQADRDREFVHQLRVGTRRLHAATETFGPLLPPRRAARFDEFLRRLRQAAGEARDLDVLLGRLDKLPAPPEKRTARRLRRLLEAQRIDAQEPLAKIFRRWKRSDFGVTIESLLAKLNGAVGSGESSASYRAFAERSLRASLARFWLAEQNVHGELEQVHEFRVVSKQLRYAMELFAGAFEPSFRQTLYPQVVEIQEFLGRLNDHASAAARFDRLRQAAGKRKLVTYLDQLVEWENAGAMSARAEFDAYWTDARRTEFEAAWSACLAGAEAVTRSTGGASPRSNSGHQGGPGAPSAAAPDR